jgi:tripartite-type tricarboxylate transporter receptor subunit TctC
MEFEVVASNPEQFEEWIRADAARWEKVVRSANVKLE